MDKKAHHELGFAPYALLAAALGLIAAFATKVWRRLAGKKRPARKI